MTPEEWDFMTKYLLRTYYNAIEAHEVRNEDYIAVEWLRDYVDDLSQTFPGTDPLTWANLMDEKEKTRNPDFRQG